MVIEKDFILIYSLKIAFGSVRYEVMNKTSGLKVSDAAPSQPVTFKTESFTLVFCSSCVIVLPLCWPRTLHTSIFVWIAAAVQIPELRPLSLFWRTLSRMFRLVHRTAGCISRSAVCVITSSTSSRPRKTKEWCGGKSADHHSALSTLLSQR